MSSGRCEVVVRFCVLALGPPSDFQSLLSPLLPRNACNNKAYKPQDIFRLLYGYSCGYNPSRGCGETDGFDTGPCKYGSKQRLYLLDVFKEGEMDEFQNFSSWLANAMTEAMYLHTVCLDPDPNSCPTSIEDPVFKKTLNEMSAAFNETSDNLAKVEPCSCPCRQVTITAMETPEDEWDCNNLISKQNYQVEVKLTQDTKEVYDGTFKFGGFLDLTEESGENYLDAGLWVRVRNVIGLNYYMPGATAPDITLTFSEDNGNCAVKSLGVGSCIVPGSDWYDRYNCAEYTKDFKSDAGDQIDKWTFRLTIEPSDQCPELAG